MLPEEKGDESAANCIGQSGKKESAVRGKKKAFLCIICEFCLLLVRVQVGHAGQHDGAQCGNQHQQGFDDFFRLGLEGNFGNAGKQP